MLPLTRAIPKPMAPLLSGTLLKHGYEQLYHSIDNICITVGYHGGVLAEYSIELGINTIINTSNKGNAWWLFNSILKYVNEPVLVLTADNITVIELGDIYDNFVSIPCAACMLVGVDPIPGVEGDFILLRDKHSSLISGLSRTLIADTYASGIQVINPFRVNELCNGTLFRSDSVSFYDVWNKLIELNSLHKSHIVPKKWFSVDTLSQLTEAEQYLV